LGLTQAGKDEGIGISIFAGDFPMIGATGPIGIAFPSSGGVLVSDYPGNVRLFPNDADGQSASWFPPGQNYGSFNAFGLARLNNNIYMAQQSLGRLVQLNDDGTLNHVVVSGLGFAEGVVADPAGARLFVSTGGGIMTVDPVTETGKLFVNVKADGLLLSADGKTLFAAQNDNNVKGYDTTTGDVVFNAGTIAGTPDGLVEGTGALIGNLFVNTNGGTIVHVDETTLVQTVVASGGSRGDFAAADPNNGSALFTQTDRIVRLTFPPAESKNLIVNGDFEQGDVGFTSDYQSSDHDGGPQFYGIVKNPKDFNNELTSFGDHTSGTGFMMSVNGATVPDKVVWSETAPVNAATNYDFATWVATCYPASPAELDFRFNGDSVGVFTAPSEAGVWKEFATTWNSGVSTSVTIQIIDKNLQFSGNDFALDDLSLTPTISLRPTVPLATGLGPAQNTIVDKLCVGPELGHPVTPIASLEAWVQGMPDTALEVHDVSMPALVAPDWADELVDICRYTDLAHAGVAAERDL
jgi:hypothetical protein